MKTLRILFAVLVGLAALAAFAGKPTPDIAPPDKRRATVDTAARLARAPATPPVPTDLPSPFSPPGFSKSDAPAAASNREAGKSAADENKGPAAPESDRDILATLAAKIPTTGTIILSGKPLLVSGTNRIEAGSRFTVVFNGQEYELELVAIDRTTFTVRYKGEEFTRPIKQGKTP